MRKLGILSSFLCLFSMVSWAQEISSADSLLLELTQEQATVTESLLPDKMLATQRLFWGEKGIYRRVGIIPRELTAESRERELRTRRTMFRIHQIIGIATAVGMGAQGYLGSQIYRPETYTTRLYEWHKGMATGVNIGYATTALMAFTSPPPLVSSKRVDNIRIHRWLSYIHLTGMITTNVLGNRIYNNFEVNKSLHRTAAFTAFGAYAAAIAIIKFEI